jgi:FkbM family methyltransferase
MRLTRFARTIVRRAVDWYRPPIDSFLGDIKGLIHVGANRGQERDVYASHALRVAWIEPIPSVFAELQENIKGLQGQTAHQYLVTDQGGKPYVFHVADNGGASSSILDFDRHAQLWPNVGMSEDITLKSVTLADLVASGEIDLEKFDAMVLDTQGSELLVLKGAVGLLPRFQYIKAEAPDFSSYAGCCQLSDLDDFLIGHGFTRVAKQRFMSAKDVGTYYDVVYRNTKWR